ncbi:CBS domain-containing protein [Gemmatimonadota bacterium]
MPTRHVGEIMVPIEQYPSVRDTATLREAIVAIEGAQLEVDLRKSLPRVLLVFDAIDVMVGYVRRRDIMRGLEPKSLINEPLDYRKKPFDVGIDSNLSEFSYDRVMKGILEQADRLVIEVMRPNDVLIDADDHVLKAVYEMVSNNLSHLPVIKDGHLVGVVRSVDVFHELAQIVT